MSTEPTSTPVQVEHLQDGQAIGDVQSKEAELTESKSSNAVTDHVTSSPDRRHYDPPKYDLSTEKIVRDLMSKAQKISQENGEHEIKDGEATEMAKLITEMVRLLNGTKIVSPIARLSTLMLTFKKAKDSIVRAVAYMRGEDHVPPMRALNQAKRDRRLSGQVRHNNNNNRRPSRGKDDHVSGHTDTETKDQSTVTPAKEGLGSINNGNDTHGDVPKQSSAEETAATKDQGSGTNNSDKENVGPASATTQSQQTTPPKNKKRHWKPRRYGSKKTSGNKGGKGSSTEAAGASEGAKELKDGLTDGATANTEKEVNAKQTVTDVIVDKKQEEHGGDGEAESKADGIAATATV
jgi:hypothetical protein